MKRTYVIGRSAFFEAAKRLHEKGSITDSQMQEIQRRHKQLGEEKNTVIYH